MAHAMEGMRGCLIPSAGFRVTVAPSPPPLARGSSATVSARRQQQSKRRKQGGGPGRDGSPDEEGRLIMVEAPQIGPDGSSLPKAPAPGPLEKKPAIVADLAEPGSQYRVFPPAPGPIKDVKGSKWSWGEDGPPNGAPETPVLPAWNPKTGFMKSNTLGTGAASPVSTSSSSQGSLGSSASSSTAAGAGPQSSQPAPPAPPEPQITLVTPVASPSEDLPPVTASQVLTSCFGTTVWMTLVAFFMRAYAQTNSPLVLGTDEKLLAEMLRLPSGLDNWANAAVLVGAAALVTAARFQLMNVWPEFREATERSNKQILTPLNWVEIALIALLSGVSEELLFRGAIIPATFLDWRGVAISAVIFGALHNSGGRNWAFAGWATAVGALYGGAFLVTKNIWVPAAAHCIANFASAAVWKSKRS